MTKEEQRQFDALRSALSEMLKAYPGGGSREAMQRQFVARDAAHKAYVDSATPEVKEKVLAKTRESCPEVADYKEAVFLFGRSILSDVENLVNAQKNEAAPQ